MKTLSLAQFDNDLAALLQREEREEHLSDDRLYNGLQVRGADVVTKVGFGVSASMALFEMAKKEGCDMVVVHHGISMDMPMMDRIAYDRFAYLVQNDISLWSAHFLLDAHPELGNASQIIQKIGGSITDPYFMHGDRAPWGWYGELPQPVALTDVVTLLDGKLSPNTIVYDFGPEAVQRVACVTGKGAPFQQDMQMLKDAGVDLYITGETHEWIREIFRESSMHFIGGGHYHTEMFGVQATQAVIANDWGLETVWLDLPNEI